MGFVYTCFIHSITAYVRNLQHLLSISLLCPQFGLRSRMPSVSALVVKSCHFSASMVCTCEGCLDTNEIKQALTLSSCFSAFFSTPQWNCEKTVSTFKIPFCFTRQRKGEKRTLDQSKWRLERSFTFLLMRDFLKCGSLVEPLNAEKF